MNNQWKQAMSKQRNHEYELNWMHNSCRIYSSFQMPSKAVLQLIFNQIILDNINNNNELI